MASLVPDGQDQWEASWYAPTHSATIFQLGSELTEREEPKPFGFTGPHASYVPPAGKPPTEQQDLFDGWMWWQ